MMKHIDYLIVGQGIAGSLLSHFLLKRKKSLLIVDHVNPSSSSMVAAGIFNPITGRRFVKTWKADEIFPFAENTYLELEKEFGEQFYYPRKIVRTLSDQKELNELEIKQKKPEYAAYMNPPISLGNQVKVEINKGGNLHINKFVRLIRDNYKTSGLLVDAYFDNTDMKIEEDGVVWNNVIAKRVIFCEGIKAMDNPWFGDLPFTHAKGEILTIKSPELNIDYIQSKGIFILPLGDDTYRVGATYDWSDVTDTPTQKGRDELIKKLETLIDTDYSVINHLAGIRPTVKDRRPLIGIHPTFPQIGIFNGLGTKGVSLGPYFAHHFVEHLESGTALNQEVDIQRFGSFKENK